MWNWIMAAIQFHCYFSPLDNIQAIDFNEHLDMKTLRNNNSAAGNFPGNYANGMEHTEVFPVERQWMRRRELTFEPAGAVLFPVTWAVLPLTNQEGRVTHSQVQSKQHVTLVIIYRFKCGRCWINHVHHPSLTKKPIPIRPLPLIVTFLLMILLRFFSALNDLNGSVMTGADSFIRNSMRVFVFC